MSSNEKKYKAFISYSHEQDSSLAKELQRGLRRFSRPWNKRWAIRVYRDESNLAVSPDLWKAVGTAVRESEYLILLASTQAAQSKWVAKEIDTFIKYNTPKRILIVLTAGEISWSDRKQEFDWSKTTALPKALRGKFRSEPKWLDLRWVTEERAVNPVLAKSNQWNDSVADLSSVLQGLPKDELVGEDRKQRRRQRLVYFSALIALILTPVALALASYYFRSESGERADTRIAGVVSDSQKETVQLVDAEEAYDQGNYVEAFQLYESFLNNYGEDPKSKALRARRDKLLRDALAASPSLELPSWRIDFSNAVWQTDLPWKLPEIKSRISDPLGYVAAIHEKEQRGIEYMERLLRDDQRIDLKFTSILGRWGTSWYASMGVGLTMTAPENRGECDVSVDKGRIVLDLPEIVGGARVMRRHELLRFNSKTLLFYCIHDSNHARVAVVFLTRQKEMVILYLLSFFSGNDNEELETTYLQIQIESPTYSVVVCTR